MIRVCWDTMLFAYWLEPGSEFASRVGVIRAAMLQRGDRLCASLVGLGELLVLPYRRGDSAGVRNLQGLFASPALEVLPLSSGAALRFAQLRAADAVSVPEALHLAIAAAAGVDLFLTNDHRLHRRQVPGIGFIAGLDVNLY